VLDIFGRDIIFVLRISCYSARSFSRILDSLYGAFWRF